jgi:hypothetical protein
MVMTGVPPGTVKTNMIMSTQRLNERIQHELSYGQHQLTNSRSVEIKDRDGRRGRGKGDYDLASPCAHYCTMLGTYA